MSKIPDDLMEQKMTCDHIMQQAAALMEVRKASGEMIIDRILTFGLLQMISNVGNDSTASMLRTLATKIEDGEFDQFLVMKGRA